MELRLRQNECLDSIFSKYVEGVHQQLVVMATGTGKAVVIANIKKRLGHLLPGRVLVFAHREELIDQLIATYKVWNPEVKVGKEMAEFYADTDCEVIVSCVASIGRNGSKRLSRFGDFDIVVCDEAHHSIAQTYLNVFESAGVLEENTQKLLVGFTATPKRRNRKTKKSNGEEELLSLKTVYKEVVYVYPIRKAIKEGWLVPLKGFRLKTDTNLDSVKVTAGDFQQDELSNAINTPKRNLQVCKSWIEHCENRQSVGFTSGIAHAKALAKVFQDNGIKAEAIWGNDPERAEKLKKHKAKEVTVLFNDSILTEGYDDWQVSCIICTAPTVNATKYTQEIGRGTRLQEGIGNLLEALAKGFALSKVDCLILDTVDNTVKNSLVTLPSLVGLNPEMDLHGGSVTAAIEKIEEIQEKYPMVDLSSITDITKINAYVESIDLFAAPYTEEVQQFSKLGWIVAADNSYVLSIPEKRALSDAKAYNKYLHEKLHLSQNDLDEWELSITSVNDDRKLGSFSTLKEAFETADDVVRRCRADRTKLMVREGDEVAWKVAPATEAVKKYLRTLSKKKPLLKCLCEGPKQLGKQCSVCKQMPITAGEASTAVDILKNSKKGTK